MLRGVIDIRTVALKAEPVVRLNGSDRVRVMAVAAPDTLFIHPALGEGAIFINLIKYLSICMIQWPNRQHRNHVIEQVAVAVCIVSHYRPARVTPCAHVQQLFVIQIAGPDNQPRIDIRRPRALR